MLNKISLAVLLVTGVFLSAFEIIPAGDKYLYKCGEKVSFRIVPGKGEQLPDTLTFNLRCGNEKPRKIELKKSNGSFPEITASLDKPGFIYIQYPASTGKVKPSAGVGFEPEKITAGRKKPAGFDLYWAKAKAELDKLPLEYEKKELTKGIGRGFKAYELKINTGDPANPLYAILTVPADAKKQTLPAYLLYAGAGTDRIYPKYLHGAATLMVNPMSVYHTGKQGSSIYQKGGKYYHYFFWGSGDLKKNCFPGMFRRVYRSLQFMKSLPEWNRKHLIVRGGSQGGAQALVAAGLDKDVTLCIASVPALCDHGGYKVNGKSGWPRYNTMGDFRKDPEKAASQLDMIDGVFFAGNIRNAKVVVTVGFIDRTCVPSSVYAAYNAIVAKDKQIYNDFRTGHTTSPETGKKISALIQEHIKGKK